MTRPPTPRLALEPIRTGLIALAFVLGCTQIPGIEPVEPQPEARRKPALPPPPVAAFGAVASAGSSRLRVAIEYPEAGAEIVAPDARGFVTGTAYRAKDMLGQFDVYIVLDVSKSTERPSGADIDGDGLVGKEDRVRRIPLFGGFFDATSSDPGDTVLACEIQAAKTLIAQLDSQSTRVGIISFSGDGDPRTPDAEVVAPLTRDYEALTAPLDALLARGSEGDTNLVAAVQLATLEFERDYLADRDREVQRVVLLISDGQGTLPLALSPRNRARAAIDAAVDAAELSTRIYTYAVGRDQALYLNTLEEIAETSAGVHERVAEPADLIARFQTLDLAEIESVTVRNLTTGRVARNLLVDPYGTFSAIVELAEGPNTLEVFARSITGDERRERLSVTYRNDASAEVLPLRALERRARLLEKRLLDLYVQQIETARQRDSDQREVDIEVVQ